MTELVYHVAVTVDNFISDKNGNTDDFLQEGEHVQDFLEQIKNYDSVLMGTKTYEYGFRYGLKPGEAGYKGIKHYIFSKSLNFDSNQDVELVKGDAVSFIANLKKEQNKKIWLCGGGELASSLLESKLIDRLILKVNPVIIGEGIPLFGNSKKKVHLQLINIKTYNSGVSLVEYKINYV